MSLYLSPSFSHVSKEEEPLVLSKGKCGVLDFVFSLLYDLALSVFLSYSSWKFVLLPHLHCLFLLSLQPRLNFSFSQTTFSHLYHLTKP